MNDEGIFDLAEYRSGGGDRVPCPRCSKPVPASATRCPHCRVHFDGEAYQFSEGLPYESGVGSKWIRLAAWALIAIIVLLLAVLAVGSILN